MRALEAIAVSLWWISAAACSGDEAVDLGELLSTGTAPDIAVTPGGTAHLVWIEAGNVMASRHEPGSDWEPATRIDGGGGSGGAPLQLEVDDDGTLMAVWSSGWSNRFVPGAGWGIATPPPASDGVDARFALATTGDAFVVWTQPDGAGARAWVARAVGGTDWESPDVLNVPSGNTLPCPAVAVDAGGIATVAWNQDGSIWARRFQADGTWSPTIAIAAAASFECPRVVVDDAGNVTALWSVLFDGVWATRFVAETGWTAAERVGPDGAIGDVGVDGTGAVTVVSRGYTSGGVHAVRFDPEAGWSPSELVIDVSGAGYPHVAVAADGRATVIWSQDDDPDQTRPETVWASQRTADGWSEPVRLGEADAAPIDVPRNDPYTVVASSQSGVVAVAWSGNSASGGIRAYVFP